MSMMRLLSAGRSLIGGQRPGKRLQMVDVRSLPKFGPKEKKGPKSNIQHPEKDETSRSNPQTSAKDQTLSVKQQATDNAPSTKFQASSFAKATEDKPEKIETSNTKDQTSVKTQVPSSKASADGLGRAQKASFLRRLVTAAKGVCIREPKIARPVAPPIQGELSLDNVKVMRNDLSDSDFEVVRKAVQKTPAQKPAIKPPEPAAPAATPPGESKKIWNRMTTLIGAGHS